MTKKPIQFIHNGRAEAVFAEEGQNLLDVLRREVGDLTPKYGCGQGTCGTCTVLVDGQPQLSCLTLAETIEGKSVETTGGMMDGSELHPLQTAFMDHFAAQCGYCTPGMLVAANALLRRNPNPSRDEVVEAIGGNICRCTGYQPIIDAILDAAGKMSQRRYG